jgi:hypothetical protein
VQHQALDFTQGRTRRISSQGARGVGTTIPVTPTAAASVNINASYIEALLGKKLIRCKIYSLGTFFIYRPSYIDVFQEICFSCFLDVFPQTLSTPNVIDKDEIYIFIYSSSYAHKNI